MPPPSYAVQHLLDPCWPQDASPEERVELTLVRDEGSTHIKDVMFEVKNGASNAVGRCVRQVVWLYPWRGDVPEKVEIAPPSTPPNGWAVLEHIRLLSSDAYAASKGVMDPIPLVQACLQYGHGLRPGLLFYVQTQPVRVFPMMQGLGDSVKATEPVADSERCVQAVLSSTVYPGSRTFVFDFSRGLSAGDPAPEDAVAFYLEPQGVQEAKGALDQTAAKAAIAELNPAVGACWEAALNRRAGVSGARTFRIRVEPTGAVGFAQVIGNQSPGATDAVDYLLDQCVAKAVLGARIPPPEGGAAEFAYSWVFALRQ